MEMQTKINTQIDPQILVTKYSHDIIEEYELSDEKTPWIAELLEELHSYLRIS